MSIIRFRGPLATLPLFKGEHLQRACSNLPHGRFKISIHLDTHTMIGWAKVVGWTGKASVRNVTYPSTFGLRQLNLRVPMESRLRPWV